MMTFFNVMKGKKSNKAKDIEFKVFFLLDWLSPMTREPNQPYYFVHRWEEIPA